MLIKCAVACVNSNGEPCFFFCKVDCSGRSYDLGKHYDRAINLAIANRYQGPFVAFDEQDGPAFLFRDDVWKPAESFDGIDTKFVRIITVIDPDSGGEVTLEIRKLATGGMVGIDGSYLDTDMPVYSPYDREEELRIPDDESEVPK